MTGIVIERIEAEADACEVLKRRRLAMGITQEEAEHKIGLTQGHLGKIEAGGKTWGRQVLRISSTLSWLLEYLGLTLVIMDRETARQLVESPVVRREREHTNKLTGIRHPSRQSVVMRITKRPN